MTIYPSLHRAQRAHLAASVLAAAVLLLAACGGSKATPTAPAGQQALPTPRVDITQSITGAGLAIAMPGGAWADAVKVQAIEPFMADTGAIVETVTNVDDELGLLASENEKSEPLFDLFWLSDAEYFIAAKNDMLSRVYFDDVGPASELYPVARGEFGVATEVGAWGIVYNADKVEDPPADWAALASVDNAARLGVTIPSVHGPEIYNLMILAIAAGQQQDAAGSTGLGQATTLGQNGATFDTFDGVGNHLVNGDVALAIYSSREAERFAEGGPPLRFVTPASGAYPVRAWLAMPANLPDDRRQRAMQFVSYVLSARAQAALAAATFTGPVNKTVKLEAALAERVRPYGLDAVEALAQPNWDLIVENYAEWFAAWGRNVNP
jgi:spermidine/putrescine-binding protein